MIRFLQKSFSERILGQSRIAPDSLARDEKTAAVQKLASLLLPAVVPVQRHRDQRRYITVDYMLDVEQFLTIVHHESLKITRADIERLAPSLEGIHL